MPNIASVVNTCYIAFFVKRVAQPQTHTLCIVNATVKTCLLLYSSMYMTVCRPHWRPTQCWLHLRRLCVETDGGM